VQRLCLQTVVKSIVKVAMLQVVLELKLQHSRPVEAFSLAGTISKIEGLLKGQGI
jgi:hypothetical protein